MWYGFYLLSCLSKALFYVKTCFYPIQVQLEWVGQLLHKQVCQLYSLPIHSSNNNRGKGFIHLYNRGNKKYKWNISEIEWWTAYLTQKKYVLSQIACNKYLLMKSIQPLIQSFSFQIVMSTYQYFTLTIGPLLYLWIHLRSLVKKLQLYNTSKK